MIWIIIDHPQQLLTAIGIVQKYKIDSNNVNLLISYHPYHDKINYDYNDLFNKIIVFSRVNLGKKILKDAYRFFIQKYKVSKLQKEIKDNDIIIGLSACQILENFIISSVRNTIKVLIVPEVQHKYAYKELNNYKQYPWMRLYNLIMKFFALYPIFYGLENGYKSKIKDGIDALRYIKPIHKVYDYIFYMVNIDNDQNNYLVNHKNSYKINYLSYKEDCQHKDKKEVVFFGNCFLLFDNFPQDKYAENSNLFLDYIRRYYEGFDLIYIPHPREVQEQSKLNLINFNIYDGGLNAELYFQKNYCNIEACFSIASTTVRNALVYNIQAYSFLKVMGFDKKQNDYFINLYGNIQDEIYIKSLDEKPEVIGIKNNQDKILKKLLEEKI